MTVTGSFVIPHRRCGFNLSRARSRYRYGERDDCSLWLLPRLTARYFVFLTNLYTVKLKLPGQANRFYEGAISEHLQIGIRAIGFTTRRR